MSITDETGKYVLPNLPLGPYRLEASLPGFRTFVQTGIELQVNTNPVINVSLQVGQVAETVEVQANAAMVETERTSIGSIIENQRILELPLNGRNVFELIQLSGAAVMQLRDRPEQVYLARKRFPSRADRPMALLTGSMAPYSTIRTTRRACRFLFPMRFRSSRWKLARCRRKMENIPARQSMP